MILWRTTTFHIFITANPTEAIEKRNFSTTTTAATQCSQFTSRIFAKVDAWMTICIEQDTPWLHHHTDTITFPRNGIKKLVMEALGFPYLQFDFDKN